MVRNIRKLKIELLKTLFWGFVLLVIAFRLVLYFIGNPWYEYLLIKKGIETTGKIIRAEEFIDSDERGRSFYDHSYEYIFKLSNGREIKSGENSFGRLSSKFTQSELPLQVKIIYLKENPKINKMKSNLSKNMSAFFFKKFLMGILLLFSFSSIGIFIIRKGFVDYKKQLKKQFENF